MSIPLDEQIRRRIAGWTQYKMETLGLSQADLARMLKVSPPFVSQVLSGKRAPGIDVLVRLREIIGMSIDEVLDTEPPTKQWVMPTAKREKKERRRKGSVA